MRPVALVGLLLVPAVLAGCVAGEQTLQNERNHFVYRVEGAGEGLDKSWEWETDGGDVAVTFSVDGASGDGRFTVHDPDGERLYEQTFGGAGSQSDTTTLKDTKAGTWRLTLDAPRIAGELSVELERTGGGSGGSPLG